MSDSARGLRVIYLAVIVLCIVASLTGAAGQDKNGGLRVANVSISRLQSEYGTIKSFNDDQLHKKDTIQTQVQTWLQNPLLSEADQKTLADLALKEKAANGPGLTPAEKAQQQKLLDQSKKLNDDYNRLQGTAVGALTNQDQQLLNNYVALKTSTENRAQAAGSQFDQDTQQKLNDMSVQVEKSIKDALGKVAKEKGINVIFNAEVAPYADYDCTDDVLKILNKK